MSKQRPVQSKKPAPVGAAPAPIEPQNPKYLPWPLNPKELGSIPRSFRLYRLNAFEWQCYVTENGVEQPIGKPDLIELVVTKMKAVMKHEGQRDFFENKAKRAEGESADA